ncbi:MAG: CHAD domain-containing protein [Acetobacteraceae bacterium]
MLNGRVTRAPGSGATEVPARPRPDLRNEVELKLLVPSGGLERLREAPIITRHARSAGTTRRLEAVYYDTPERTLFSHGLSLRVRRSGRRFTQTLKRAPANGQPFARGEWEVPTGSLAPDFSAMPMAEIGAPFDTLAAGELRPVFTTKVRRRTQHLDLLGAVIEVAFDEGCIEAGEHREPLNEIELEIKSGEARVLYDLGIELLDAAPLRIGTQSKSDRGYGLAFGLAPKSTKAVSPSITAEYTLDDTIGVLLGTCQHHLLANQIVAEGGRDPEGVHQMRVALRRFRTACILLRRELGSPTLEGFAAEAKWLAGLLGGARDWDVFITETVSAPAEALQLDIADFEGLRQAAEPHRMAAYADLREALASPRYNRFQLSLRHWIESRGWRNELDGQSLPLLLLPAPEFAARVMTRLYRKVLHQGAHFRHLQPEARHRVRISLKKLRYAAEFFQGLHGGRSNAKDYLACIADLQDALGHDHDAITTRPFLLTLAADPVSPDVQRAIGAVMGWQACDRIAVGSTLRKHWRQFKSMPVFWS